MYPGIAHLTIGTQMFSFPGCSQETRLSGHCRATVGIGQSFGEELLIVLVLIYLAL